MAIWRRNNYSQPSNKTFIEKIVRLNSTLFPFQLLANYPFSKSKQNLASPTNNSS